MFGALENCPLPSRVAGPSLSPLATACGERGGVMGTF
jgi:hypothetical protein